MKLKDSWDMVSSPIHHKDTLILGAPGMGYETLIEQAIKAKLPIKNIGDFGYRSSSLYPTQWLINLDEAYYRTTAPWEPPRVWIGYAQNWQALIRLPWHKVLYFDISDELLSDRISKYRVKHSLDEHEYAEKSDEVSRGLLLIRDMLRESPLTSIPIPSDVRELMKYTNSKGIRILSDDLVTRLREKGGFAG